MKKVIMSLALILSVNLFGITKATPIGPKESFGNSYILLQKWCIDNYQWILFLNSMTFKQQFVNNPSGGVKVIPCNHQVHKEK